jgi:hypothetical protein
MGQWTTSDEEARHLAYIADKTGVHGAVILKNGERIEGLVLPASAGNNAGEGGMWKYHAEIVVAGRTIDVLDVAEIMPGKAN